MNAILYIALGALIGGGLAFFRILKLEREKAELKARAETIEAARAQMGDHFKLTAQEAVKNAHESFLQLAQEKLAAAQKDGSHDLEKRQKAIDDLIKPVQENLKALSSAVEQAKGTDMQLRQDLQNLSRETAKLVGALRDPSAQGAWGEFILEGLLDKSGLIKGVHYETQVSMSGESGRQRPDAVIDMQDGFKIAVDAKAQINEFVTRLGENLTEEEYNQIALKIAKQVEARVKELGRKGYFENLQSPDFTVMFLPSEHIYSIALRARPDLVDYASSVNVIIASPTLLMSLLRVVSLSWRQVELAKNAQEISARGAELYKRLLAFTGHIEKIGKGLQGAMKGYNDAIGSLERSVLPSARKFKELQGRSDAKEIEILPIPEETPRLVNLSAEDEKEKRRA